MKVSRMSRSQACNQVIATWPNARPQIVWAFYHRGNAYTAQEDYDRAIQDYDIAIELKPDHSHAYADRGLAYFGKGAFERAVEDYNVAIRLDPAYAPTYQDRCYSLAILGHIERALVDCNKALSLSPRDPIFLDSRGYAYLRKGDFDRAIADYKAALKSHPTFDTALFGRAIAYAAQGNQAQATHDLKAARSINPKIDQQMVKIHLSAPAGPVAGLQRGLIIPSFCQSRKTCTAPITISFGTRSRWVMARPWAERARACSKASRRLTCDAAGWGPARTIQGPDSRSPIRSSSDLRERSLVID